LSTPGLKRKDDDYPTKCAGLASRFIATADDVDAILISIIRSDWGS
jgi:hypothetical protein